MFCRCLGCPCLTPLCGRLCRVEEPEPGAEVRVWGNMVAFVERLDDEHFKSLQARPQTPGWHI